MPKELRFTPRLFDFLRELKNNNNAVAGLVAGWRWPLALLLVIYNYTYYVFASYTTHVTAIYPAFLSVAIAVGASPLLAALSYAFFSSLFAALTHYGTGSAVVIYGAAT